MFALVRSQNTNMASNSLGQDSKDYQLYWLFFITALNCIKQSLNRWRRIWLMLPSQNDLYKILDNTAASEISFIRIWACVDQMVESKGSEIQSGQNCTLSPFWGQFCMERLYGDLVRCIIICYKMPSFEIQTVIFTSLESIWRAFNDTFIVKFQVYPMS